MASSDSDADLFRYRENQTDFAERQAKRKRYRAKKARQYRANQRMRKQDYKSQCNAFMLSFESDQEHNQTSSGIPIAAGGSHILQELRNDSNTAEHYDDGLHTACDFLADVDFSSDNFPVEDDPVEYYAGKFPVSEAVDKILLSGKYNESDEEAISLLDHMEEMSIYNQGCSSIESSGSDSDEDLQLCAAVGDDGPGTVWDDLREAVQRTHMNTVQIDAVLEVFHKHPPASGRLPKTERTLCRIMNSGVDMTNLKQVSGHDYYYFGLKKQLLFYLSLYPKPVLEAVDVLMLTWNNDGLPLFKSTRQSAWPILCCISNLKPIHVFVVLLTAGVGKPTDLDYLEEFTNELKFLMEEGLEFECKRFRVLMNAAVCDAPARAQIKHTMNFNARYGCGQCETEGFHDGWRMIWPQTTNLVLQTNESFRQKAQPGHHRPDGHDSPLLALDIDMIQAFPPDFMHQGGGCMMKILLWNLQGPKTAANGSMPCKMSARNISVLNKRLCQIKEYIPNIFTRKARSTTEIAYYKMTEVRQLLLYTGKVVFKGLMATDAHYKHLLIYNVLCALMVDENMAKPFHELQDFLARQFCSESLRIYGSAFMVSNVHAHLHFPQVAANYGSIDTVSAHVFENKLGELKRSICSSHKPIISLIRGVLRKQSVESKRQLVPPSQVLMTTEPNNVYVDMSQGGKDGKCYQLTHLERETCQLLHYTNATPFFTSPVDSRLVGCYLVSSNHYTFVTLTCQQVQTFRRGILIPLKDLEGAVHEDQNRTVIMSVLHDPSSSHY